MSLMAEVLKERGLVEVFAMRALPAGADAENVPVVLLAWHDMETRMFFTRDEGHPIADNPEDSARNTMAVVDAHDQLTGSLSPAGIQRRLDLLRKGSVSLQSRQLDLANPLRPSKWPDYRRAHGSVWCAIVAQETPRYTHMTGLAIYWEAEAPCVVDHDWLWDTHTKEAVDPHDGGQVTLLGRTAARDMLLPKFRGAKGLPELRLAYAAMAQMA